MLLGCSGVLIGSALYFLHKCCAENLLFRLVWFAFEEVHQLNSDENCEKRDGHRLTFAEWRNLFTRNAGHVW